MSALGEGISPESMLSEVYRAVIGTADDQGLIHLARQNAHGISRLNDTVFGRGEGRKDGIVYRVGQVEDVIVWFRRLWWILAVNAIVIAIGIPAWVWAVLRSGGG